MRAQYLDKIWTNEVAPLYLGVAGLAGPEVGSAVLVLHSVLVRVGLRGLRRVGGRGRPVWREIGKF